MKRFLLLAGIFCLLISLQFGLIASLPGWLALTPLLPVASLSFSIHFGKREALWWLVGQGIFLDYFHLGFVPWETVSFAFAAAVVFFCARHVFSGRSLYGIAACAIALQTSLFLSEGGMLFLADLRGIPSLPWPLFLTLSLQQGMLLLGLSALAFVKSAPMKKGVSFYETL